MNPNKLNTHTYVVSLLCCLQECDISHSMGFILWFHDFAEMDIHFHTWLKMELWMNMRNSTFLAGWWIWKVRNLCKPTNSFVQCPWLLSTNDNSFGKNGWPSFCGLIRTSEGQWIAVAGEATLVYQTASMVSF